MMLRRNDRNLENIPVGALGIIALDGWKCNDKCISWNLTKWTEHSKI